VKSPRVPKDRHKNGVTKRYESWTVNALREEKSVGNAEVKSEPRFGAPEGLKSWWGGSLWKRLKKKKKEVRTLMANNEKYRRGKGEGRGTR